jgi:hypothetical protein
MDTTTRTSDRKLDNQHRLGKLEVGLGVLFLAYVVLSLVFGHLAPPPKLPYFSDLSVFVATISAATLLIAGGGLLHQSERWPYLWHVPLAMWILIAFLSAL